MEPPKWNSMATLSRPELLGEQLDVWRNGGAMTPDFFYFATASTLTILPNWRCRRRPLRML